MVDCLFLLLADTLPYLLHACFVLDQGLVSLLLQLIHTALSGVPVAKPESSRDAVIAAVLGAHKKKGGAAKEEEKTKKEQKAAAKEAKEKAKPG